MSRGGNDFPIDIVEDILHRLPSKTVLRFKTASKTWYALISDPLFINCHSKRVSPNPKVLLSTTDKSDFLRSKLNLLVLDYGPVTRFGQFKENINFPKVESPIQPYKIIGSSFGLVCIATDYCGSFYIWNPTTRESRKIPNFGSEKIEHYEYLHGLSYDSVANDFKVVISLYPIEYTERPITFNVFSLKANSWKQIVSPFPYYYNPSKYPSDWQYRSTHYGATASQFKSYAATTSATILNAVLFHWIVRAPNEANPHIIAFDSRRESFYKLQIPKEKFDALRSSKGLLCLFEHGGCLCLLCQNNKHYHIHEIWMMKEYSDPKSWLHLHNTYGFDHRVINKPLCITPNIELLVHTVDKIELCRQKTEMNLAEFGWYKFNQEGVFVDVWNFEKVVYRDRVQLQPEFIFGTALVDETLISPHDIAHETLFKSVFTYFFRAFNVFQVVVNFFLNLWRDLSYLFRDFE